MLRHGEPDDEHKEAGRLASAHGATLMGLDINASLDKVVIGFGLA